MNPKTDLNPRRLPDYIMPTLILILGIGLVTFLILAAANLVFPNLVGESGLSFGTIGSTLSGQVAAVSHLTGLSLLTDLGLLIAAYLLVCLLLWLQGEFRTYLANRSHF